MGLNPRRFFTFSSTFNVWKRGGGGGGRGLDHATRYWFFLCDSKERKNLVFVVFELLIDVTAMRPLLVRNLVGRTLTQEPRT